MIDASSLAAFEDSLLKDLLRHSSSSGYLPAETQMLLTSEDFLGSWAVLLQPLVADAVREFNDYPEFTLACAFYAGLASAVLWDSDWELFSKCTYESLTGPDGFDHMDDYIVENFLGIDPVSDEGEAIATFASSCSSVCLVAMRHAPIEPGTSDALKILASCLKAMYLVGASVELCNLGYAMHKITPDSSLS